MSFTIFYKEGCPFCERAENHFNAFNLNYNKYVLNQDFSPAEFKHTFGEGATYPQVFYKKHHIGGSDDTIHFINNKYN